MTRLCVLQLLLVFANADTLPTQSYRGTPCTSSPVLLPQTQLSRRGRHKVQTLFKRYKTNQYHKKPKQVCLRSETGIYFSLNQGNQQTHDSTGNIKVVSMMLKREISLTNTERLWNLWNKNLVVAQKIILILFFQMVGDTYQKYPE